MEISQIPRHIIVQFEKGSVIPAMPLALSPDGSFDRKHQKALLRYYMDAGAGGIAVGVHTTQFEIRDAKNDLFGTVLEFCSRTINDWCERKNVAIMKIAGICGKTEQALQEARLAVKLGYHAGLLSLGAFVDDEGKESLLEHCRKVSEIIPVMGFYLQPAAGGRILPYSFWQEFAGIENVLGIKIAPFNRYQTLDVVRAICEAGREDDIILYTGNDDNILADLLTGYEFNTAQGMKKVRIRGGLLGHWAVWTKKAVELLEDIHSLAESGAMVPPELLTRAVEITDSNAAFFDAANNFRGCISGIHEILYRQGLFSGVTCLDPANKLSPGQINEIDRVLAAYPHLNDDDFVSENLDSWLNY